MDEFRALLQSALDETGRELQGDLTEISLYASERAAHLAASVGQPGFEEAVIAERDNVAIRAGISAATNADAFDQRIVGIIQGGLSFLARALA